MAALGWLCGFAGVQGVGEVSAEPIQQFSVQYTSAPGCPTQERFVAGVEGRTALARYVPDASGVRVLLQIEDSVSGTEPFVAHLSLSGDVEATPRSISAGSCEELVNAAALIVALALDPGASAEPRQGPSALAPAPVVAAPTAPAATAIAPAATPIALAPTDVSTVGLFTGAGLTNGVGSGVAALWSLGVALRAKLSRNWDVGFSLSGMYARGDASAGAGSAQLALLGARVGVSPYVFATAGWLVEPRLSFDFGRLEAEGRGVPNANSDSAPWLGPGVELLVQRRLAQVLGASLAIGARGGATWSLARDYFYFREDSNGRSTRIFEQPALIGQGGLSLELAW
ncbi:MAG: hypothetical protein H6718_23085 [Polyangiaceae bacterium]|nr:hypothetical protein [Polyangiaceae bacterium]